MSRFVLTAAASAGPFRYRAGDKLADSTANALPRRQNQCATLRNAIRWNGPLGRSRCLRSSRGRHHYLNRCGDRSDNWRW
jgi:hypothetical protein